MAQTKSVYGLIWPRHLEPLEIEIQMCRRGGRWKGKNGLMYGEGLFFHFRRVMQLLWPEIVWHKWNNLVVEKYLLHRTIAILGPASCVAGYTRIFDPYTGKSPTIEELCESQTAPVVMTMFGPKQARVPFIKGVADLFEVTMLSGRKFTCTAQHRVLAINGDFCLVENLRPGSLLLSYDASPFLSTLEHDRSTHVLDAEHSRRIAGDFLSGYPACSCFGDAQLHFSSDNAQLLFPQRGDVPARTTYGAHSDGQAGTAAHIRFCQSHGLPSKDCYARQGRNMENAFSPSHGSERAEPFCASFRFSSRSQSEKYRSLPIEALPADADYMLRSWTRSIAPSIIRGSSVACDGLWVRCDTVSTIRRTGHDVFYDIQVPDAHHYFAEGAIHHNSGKTNSAALCGITDYFIFPECTTVIVCSTTKELLEQRVWGEIKRFWRSAKRQYSWIPGNLIEGRLRIVTDSREDMDEGRDFINGLLGVPIKKGNDYVGIGDFAGMKNKRVRLIGDELSLLPPAFIHAISNLDKNPDLKVLGLGNPKDPTDALGMLAEPAAHLGGWDGGIDQTPGTKTWETRRHNGICIQLPGDDSPNLDGKLGAPLITQEAIDRDMSFYGTDSVWFSMMDLGRMPRGLGSRRILTRQICLKFHAMDEPNWHSVNRTKIAFLDAAYGGVGGDRCIFGEFQFGEEVTDPNSAATAEAVINQRPLNAKKRQIIALVDTVLVPVSVNFKDLPCDQIVNFVRSQCESRGIPPENFYFDAGMRTALVQAFSRLWSNTVNSLDCGGAPSDRKVSADIDVPAKDYYANNITEMWYSVRLTVEAGQFRGMSEEVLGEFCQREWGTVGKNKIQVEPKVEMKKKTGRSPDLADAVAVGLAGAIQRGFVIERLKSPRQAVRDDRWRRELRQKASNLWRAGELNHAA